MNKQILPVLLALFVAVGTAGPVAAASDLSSAVVDEQSIGRDDPTVVLASEALAKEFDVPIEVAVDRILEQESLFGLAADIEEKLGEDFAGAWVDHAEGGALHVASIDGVRLDVELAGLDQVVWIEARSSLESMRMALAEISIQIDSRSINAHSMWIDVRENSLVVETEKADTSGILDSVLNQIDGKGDVRIKVQQSIAPEAMQAECVDTHCDAPLRGGSLIQELPGGVCTAGFLATNAFGQERLITAGHCPFGATNNYRAAQPRSGGWHIIGQPAAVRFTANGDFATLVINNVPGWEPRGIVVVHDSNANNRPTVRDERYPINGVGSSGQVGIGGFLCVTGAVNLNPTRCGQLQSVGQTSTYRGVTVNNLGRIGVTVCGGMSGGPVYVGGLGYGIVAAGGGSTFNTNWNTWALPTRTSTCRGNLLYQGLTQILNDFNLTLMAP